jgi:hypothetical protein
VTDVDERCKQLRGEQLLEDLAIALHRIHEAKRPTPSTNRHKII